MVVPGSPESQSQFKIRENTMVRSDVLGRANRESEVIRAWKKAPVVQKGWKGLEPGEPPKVLEMAAKQSTPSMEWNALYACLGHGRRKESKLNKEPENFSSRRKSKRLVSRMS